MPILMRALAFTATALVLGGCCRDTIREMSSLKDVAPQRQAPQRSAKVAPDGAEKSSKVAREIDDDESRIETGSISKPNCQGQHLAYQATKEYLKNFGPRPPDEPGARGPCDPNAQ